MKCLICKNKNTCESKTKVCEFLAERMFEKSDIDVGLIFCPDCGFAYYTLRPNDEQIQRFYTGYRGEEYQKQRQKYDCWYTPELNRVITDDLNDVKSKKVRLSEILKKYVDLTKIKSVLDYGGDKGQNLPDDFDYAQRFVYDLSGSEPCEGIVSIGSNEEIGKYDFVICQGVLEHASDPEEMVHDLIKVAEVGGYLYIEVPFDSPFYKKRFHNFQFLFSKYFSFNNLVKHYIKMRKNRFSNPMNEHLNYFTQKSLETLLKNAGCLIVHSQVATVNLSWCSERNITVLARLTKI